MYKTVCFIALNCKNNIRLLQNLITISPFLLYTEYFSSDFYFFPVMHKQRVLQPVTELPLVGKSSDCIKFFFCP